MGATIDIAELEAAGRRFTLICAIVEQYHFMAGLKIGRKAGGDGEITRVVADCLFISGAGDANTRVFADAGFS